MNLSKHFLKDVSSPYYVLSFQIRMFFFLGTKGSGWSSDILFT